MALGAARADVRSVPSWAGASASNPYLRCLAMSSRTEGTSSLGTSMTV